MTITKEDLNEALKKAESIKDELIGKNEDEAVAILTEKTGMGKDIAKKVIETVKNVDLSKVDLRKIDLSKIEVPDKIRNIFGK